MVLWREDEQQEEEDESSATSRSNIWPLDATQSLLQMVRFHHEHINGNDP